MTWALNSSLCSEVYEQRWQEYTVLPFVLPLLSLVSDPMLRSRMPVKQLI